MLTRDPCLLHTRLHADELSSLDDPLLDRYVGFVASRCRPNTVRATVSDLRAVFTVVAKDPRAVTTSDVLGFIAAQRQPRAGRANVASLVALVRSPRTLPKILEPCGHLLRLWVPNQIREPGCQPRLSPPRH